MLRTRNSCQTSMTLEFSRHIFEKLSNIEFHETPSRGSRVVPCGRTDNTTLTVVSRNFANAPKNAKYYTFFMLTAQKKTQTCSTNNGDQE